MATPVFMSYYNLQLGWTTALNLIGQTLQHLILYNLGHNLKFDLTLGLKLILITFYATVN